ncbi:MAG: outer membrane beta-barrel protein [Flavobacteriaceae bacterium]|nr:outer membrane beta-barrel protein [Flavobacteriaceae bacterium]
MKNTLLFLLFFVGFNLYSQTGSKWQFGIEFSLDYLSNVDFLAIEEQSEFGYSIDFNKTNFSFGITSRHSLNQGFTISSGILYSNKDFSGTLDCNDPCEFVAINSPELLKQRFINIPMSLVYKISDTTIKPNIEIGINNNIEIKNDVEVESNSYFLEGFIGVSFLYQFNTNWNIGLGYKYQTALTNLYKSDKFNLNTSSIVLNFNYGIK